MKTITIPVSSDADVGSALRDIGEMLAYIVGPKLARVQFSGSCTDRVKVTRIGESVRFAAY